MQIPETPAKIAHNTKYTIACINTHSGDRKLTSMIFFVPDRCLRYSQPAARKVNVAPGLAALPSVTR